MDNPGHLIIQADAGSIDTVDGNLLVPKITTHVRRLPGLQHPSFRGFPESHTVGTNDGASSLHVGTPRVFLSMSATGLDALHEA